MGLEFDNTLPIYVQIVENFKVSIVAGKYKAGDRLPSVRDLAFEAKVNPNTMQRALVELENSGLIFTERTNGKFITKDESIIENFKRQFAYEICDKFLTSMNEIGIDKNTSIGYLQNYKGDKNGNSQN